MATFYYALTTDFVHQLGTWAAEASADAGYPASNIPKFDDLNLGNPAKLTIDGAGGWTVDFGSAQRVDWIMAWHNAKAGQQVQYQGDTTSAFSGGALITTTQVSAGARPDGFFTKMFCDVTQISGYSTGGKRWWRVHFPDSGNGQNRGLKVMMGSANLRTFARTTDNTGLLLSGNKAPQRHRNLTLKTDFGYAWKYDLQDAPSGLSGQIIASRQGTSYADLVTMFQTQKGSYSPFPLIPDKTINEVLLVRLGDASADGLSLDEMDITQLHPGVNMVSVAVSEVSGGGPEWV